MKGIRGLWYSKLGLHQNFIYLEGMHALALYSKCVMPMEQASYCLAEVNQWAAYSFLFTVTEAQARNSSVGAAARPYTRAIGRSSHVGYRSIIALANQDSTSHLRQSGRLSSHHA